MQLFFLFPFFFFLATLSYARLSIHLANESSGFGLVYCRALKLFFPFARKCLLLHATTHIYSHALYSSRSLSLSHTRIPAPHTVTLDKTTGIPRAGAVAKTVPDECPGVYLPVAHIRMHSRSCTHTHIPYPPPHAQQHLIRQQGYHERELWLNCSRKSAQGCILSRCSRTNSARGLWSVGLRLGSLSFYIILMLLLALMGV